MRKGAATLEERLEAPIVVGALGPKMCAVAGGSSDGVLLNWLTAEHVAPSAANVTAATITSQSAVLFMIPLRPERAGHCSRDTWEALTRPTVSTP